MLNINEFRQAHNPVHFFASTCLNHYGFDDNELSEQLANIMSQFIRWSAKTSLKNQTVLDETAVLEGEGLSVTSLSQVHLGASNTVVQSNA